MQVAAFVVMRVLRHMVELSLFAGAFVACAGASDPIDDDAADEPSASGDGVVLPGRDPRPSPEPSAHPITATDGAQLPSDDDGPTAPSCPPDAPFVCPAQNARGYACSAVACAPSCEQIGCAGGFVCIDCGAGAECAPPDRRCN